MDTPHYVIDSGVENAIKAIGQSLIDRAKDIANDCEGVESISIYALLTPSDTVSFEVFKKYVAKFKEV